MTPDELRESVAEVMWNANANVSWAEFFGRHPEKKSFYLEQADAAIRVVLNAAAVVCAKRFDACSRGSDNWGRTACLECEQEIRALMPAKEGEL